MEERGTVSLWVGRAASAEALERAVEIAYSEDGDSLGSPFGRGFGLEWYDDDFREAGRLAPFAATLADALQGFSYSDLIAPRFAALAGAAVEPDDDCCVLLYDVRYDGSATRWTDGSVSLRFVGSVRYDE